MFDDKFMLIVYLTKYKFVLTLKND